MRQALPMRTLGVDLSAQPKETAARFPDWRDGCAAPERIVTESLTSSALLESTPSLPWRFSGGKRGHGRVLEGTKALHINLLPTLVRARAYPHWVGRMFP